MNEQAAIDTQQSEGHRNHRDGHDEPELCSSGCVPKIPPHALRLRLDFRTLPIDGFVKRTCIRAVLLHVLYARGIIPCPAQELLRAHHEHCRQEQAEADGDANPHQLGPIETGQLPSLPVTDDRPYGNKRRRVTGAERKMIKCGGELSSILQDLDVVFGLEEPETLPSAADADASRIHIEQRLDASRQRGLEANSDGKGRIDEQSDSDSDAEDSIIGDCDFCSDVRCAVITVGPSFISPREQYVIRFPSPSPQDSSAQATATVPAHHMETSQRVVSGRFAAVSTHPLPPPDLRERIEHEIGRRCVREFVQGMASSCHASSMFSTTKNSMQSSKVSIAFLVGSHVCEGMNERRTAFFARRLVVNRNFEVRTPRMLSKRQHRPFAAMDVLSSADAERALAASERNVDSWNGTWISLRATMKGLRA